MSQTFCFRRWHSVQEMTTRLLFLGGPRSRVGVLDSLISCVSAMLRCLDAPRLTRGVSPPRAEVCRPWLNKTPATPEGACVS